MNGYCEWQRRLSATLAAGVWASFLEVVIGGWVLKEKHFAPVAGTVLPSLPNSCSVDVPRRWVLPPMPGVKVEAKEENRLESLLQPSLPAGD